MPNLNEVNQQVSQLNGVHKWVNRKEIKELPDILWEDENIVDLIPGFYNGGNGLLVATDRRLIFLDKGLLYGLRVEDFPLSNISSIQYSTGLLLGDITIFASGNKAKIKNVDKHRVKLFAENVRHRITLLKESNSNSSPSKQVNHGQPIRSGFDDMVRDLERLAKLRDAGILTPEEFDDQKRRLLDG